jgi:hypothetical protein
VVLLLAALVTALVMGAAFVSLRDLRADAVALHGEPMTDAQAAGQVVASAKQIVSVAQLQDATGGYAFVSCKNENEPPYQAAIYMSFRLPQSNSVKYPRDVAASMAAHPPAASMATSGELPGRRHAPSIAASTTRASPPCGSTVSAATRPTTATTIRSGRKSPNISGERSWGRLSCNNNVSSHRPCLKPTAVSAQRRRIHGCDAGEGCCTVGVDDDGDDFANTRTCALGEQRVEKQVADSAADRIGYVYRILHRLAVGRTRLPRRAQAYPATRIPLGRTRAQP